MKISRTTLSAFLVLAVSSVFAGEEYTLQASASPPSWETYVPAVAVGLLAAVVAVLLVENRSLRKAASGRGSPPA